MIRTLFPSTLISAEQPLLQEVFVPAVRHGTDSVVCYQEETVSILEIPLFKVRMTQTSYGCPVLHIPTVSEKTIRNVCVVEQLHNALHLETRTSLASLATCRY